MNKIIALDADGVLLDYNQAYGNVWARAFGSAPALVNPEAYWARDRWGVPHLTGAELDHFRSHFDSSFWSTIPELEGAVEACHALHDAGYRLIVVSALPPAYTQDRLSNLLFHGFPIEDVIAAPPLDDLPVSPKAQALGYLNPVAFVDDYLPYLRGVPRHSTHMALVTRETEGSPNTGEELRLADSMHTNLSAFADWWLSGGGLVR